MYMTCLLSVLHLRTQAFVLVCRSDLPAWYSSNEWPTQSAKSALIRVAAVCSNRLMVAMVAILLLDWFKGHLSLNL